MLQAVYELFNYDIAAEDGDIGSIIDVYFDDRFWSVRYLVIDTGGWLSGRQVLIAADALRAPDRERTRLPVALSRQAIKDSPPVETDLPVSRQREAELYDHYGWVYYWAAAPGAAAAAVPVPVAADTPEPPAAAHDPRLRSVREVVGYAVSADDGDIGHVEDLLVDTTRWRLPYFVVDTRNWLPGRKVVVATEWLTAINWGRRSVQVDLAREAIKNSPPYEPDQLADARYLHALHQHYDRPPSDGV